MKDGSALLDTTGYGRQSLGQSDDGENRGRNWMVVRRHGGQAAPPETFCIPKDWKFLSQLRMFEETLSSVAVNGRNGSKTFKWCWKENFPVRLGLLGWKY